MDSFFQGPGELSGKSDYTIAVLMDIFVTPSYTITMADTISCMDTGLYFHIPFCNRRCGYCDFVTFAGFNRLIPDYFHALEKQVMLFGKGEQVDTIYFGGGTPSLVPADEYKKLFSEIFKYFLVDVEAEITLEANPGTVTEASLAEFREIGFNRISFGMQSARESELELLDRSHLPGDIERALTWARAAGFGNINLDLIFGLPGQSMEDWKYSLHKALDLSPQHLSVYSLIVEEGTPLEKRIKNGILVEPDEDVAADQYDWTCEELDRSGFEHYEISNWAQSTTSQDFRCRHNLRYWRLQSYHGFGCGAVGFISKGITSGQSFLIQNPPWINTYIHQVERAFSSKDENPFLKPISAEYEMETRLFVGFRLLEEGIEPVDFKNRYGLTIENVFGKRLNKLIQDGLIEVAENGQYRLTRSSWLVANRVFREFSSLES